MAPPDYLSTLPPAEPPASPFDPSATPSDDSCPFCLIASKYPPFDPTKPPNQSARSLDPDATSPAPSAFVVLSTPLLVAFLDILPLSTGHVLLCPRSHRPKLTDATPAESKALGYHLRILSSAVTRATGVGDWNIVQNNGAAAAQVVHHMHFHVIPRPELNVRNGGKGRERFTSTMFGRGAREELDEEEGAVLAGKIRAAIAELLLEEKPRL
ncbi:HIT-like domain-containing protein [Phialemonium atrogriseum]|uniref:HIT-like domain-containing protein n=1 Tax=Phialemonium atrogriseum TaxID=1093897 RepID=A0AAJ0FKZ2_9PEZI|nr:HIT-like domain-containing protein [Phialemonium atrogriseum]KAK1771612.1 HIT-like domain-containing protein [Phialemonium atrogriseum]